MIRSNNVCPGFCSLVYGSEETKKWYEDDMSYIPLQFKTIQPFEQITLDELTITAFPVEHTEGALGFVFEANNKRIAYFGDIKRLPKQEKNVLENLDVAIVDAVYIEGGTPGDDTHMIGDEVHAFIKEIGAQKTILTHISSFHEKDHEELGKKYSDYTISYDGMEIDL